MNCDCFDQRMNALLDDHQSIVADPLIQSHSQYCESCRQKLVIWHQIDDMVAVQSPGHDAGGRWWMRVSVLAAGVAVALLLSWGFQRNDLMTAEVSADRQVGMERTESSTDSGSRDQERGIDPNQWWQSVEPQQWIAQTMPTVRTVQESVAPLSRSFRQAVDLLTFGRAT